MKQFRIGLWVMAIGVSIFVVAQCLAEEPSPSSEWVKGGVVVGVSNSGSCIFKPFVKVGEADSNPDSGESQILGYTPGEVIVNDKGDIVYERAEENSFIPLKRWKSFHGRVCRCPPYDE